MLDWEACACMGPQPGHQLCPCEEWRTSQLARCEHEQRLIQERPDVASGAAPAWLVTLGMEDWEFEKQLIAKE